MREIKYYIDQYFKEIKDLCKQISSTSQLEKHSHKSETNEMLFGLPMPPLELGRERAGSAGVSSLALGNVQEDL